MNILISGAGIAGLTTAFWLHRYGHNVTIVEKVKNFRSRYGYLIDFWGPGFEVANKMGLLPKLTQKHYSIPKMIYVNEQGKNVGYLDIIKLRKVMYNREFTFLRGDLEDAIYEVVADNITIQSGITITSFEQDAKQVFVHFSDGTQQRYDLLIGADGIHSHVRTFLFGEEEQYTRYLGYHIAAFIQPNELDVQNFVSYSKSAKQVAIFPIRDNRLATYFMYKETDSKQHNERGEIYRHFEKEGWIIPQLLESLHHADEVFLDSVTQIILPQWYQGRVVLVGDACQCLTLLAGQGASMAMAGGYLLAKELHRQSNYLQAFEYYQNQLLPEIKRKQKQARQFIRQFIPNTAFGITFRNAFTNILNIPLLSRLYFDRSFQFSRKYLPKYLLED